MASPSTAAPSAVRVDHVTVRFDDTVAVRDATVAWSPGLIHAVVGQNGAGKSTLARVLAGLQNTVHGRLHVGGDEVRCGDHVGARRAGVDMVHQHSSLVPTMTVAEALEVTETADEQLRRYRRRTLREKWRTRLQRAGVDIDVTTTVGDLSVEAVQSLEIARANPGPGGVLILDEPTAVLPPPSIERLFAQLRDLVARHVTVIVVLHKLGEVRAIADTVTVLRGGDVTLATAPIASVTDRELGAHIIGAAATAARLPDLTRVAATTDVTDAAAEPSTSNDDRAGLALQRCSTTGSRHEVALHDLSIDARPGEVIGIAGVDGNGQRSVVEVLCGVTRPSSGTVVLRGRDITDLDVRDRRDLGVHVVPFDRFEEGIAGTEPLWRNISLWNAEERRRWPGLPFVSVRAMRRHAEERLNEFAVSHAGSDQEARTLSGGNVQRLILARELDGARALVVAQPTRGLDIGGISFVWSSLRELADDGVPIVVVSSDLDELLANCDRLYVIRGGRVAFETRPPFDRAEIGAAMTGGRS